MKFIIEAACGCNTGKIRKHNEDNFYFDGKCMEPENSGLKNIACIEGPLKNGLFYAVFDGMGGEAFGEIAAYKAARQLQLTERKFSDFFIPERVYLTRAAEELNRAVYAAKEELLTEHMGTTMVGLFYSSRYVYVCNIGDSRAYRLRNGEFLQLSHDHVAIRPGQDGKKAPLTQYLGMDPEEVEIEPYIAKGGLKKGDMYLLCSDGLTDMLTNFEISDIMLKSEDTASCVEDLIRAALEHGGRDNITVIVSRIF